ncbi:MAG: DUF2934 domain-containing protein [Opitutaceae bacterium]
MNTPTHEEIAQRAYQIWQSRGDPADADHHWLEAERELNASAAKSESDPDSKENAAPPVGQSSRPRSTPLKLSSIASGLKRLDGETSKPK